MMKLLYCKDYRNRVAPIQFVIFLEYFSISPCVIQLISDSVGLSSQSFTQSQPDEVEIFKSAFDFNGIMCNNSRQDLNYTAVSVDAVDVVEAVVIIKVSGQ